MRAIAISCVLIFSGCLSNNTLMTSSIADNNVSKLHQLHVGMTQEEVYQIMRYPSREDQITTEDGCYDIWFYVTKSTVLDQSRLMPRNLTPLIFKDGVFVGEGYDYYNWLLKKVNAPPTPNEPIKKDLENIELEKKLAPPPLPPAVKPAKKSTPISMNSKPKKSLPADEKKTDDEDSSKVKLDEEDRDMLEQEQEQNFNTW